MECVRTVSYTVLLNGRAHGFVKPERGIIQGDSLSPFLFILCAEILVSVMNNPERAGSLTGIRLDSSGPMVQHLFFADDSLFLCKVFAEDIMEIKRCLHLYEVASGQVINYSKSSIIFG